MTDIHSCSLHCDRPGCIKAQRDELRDKMAQLEQELLGCVEYIPCCTDQTCPKCKPTQPEQEPVAWREFDGEGGYTYFAYEDNETWREEYIKRNGEKYADWVEPLYADSSASHLQLLSDKFIYKVVRTAQPHLDDDCADWRHHFAECKYWLEIAHGITTPTAAQPAPIKWSDHEPDGTHHNKPTQEEIQRLRALVRAQQMTIDKLEAALAKPEQEPVQVSPLEFATMVIEKEHLIGKPLFWAEWPNKERNT